MCTDLQRLLGVSYRILRWWEVWLATYPKELGYSQEVKAGQINQPIKCLLRPPW